MGPLVIGSLCCRPFFLFVYILMNDKKDVPTGVRFGCQHTGRDT